MIVVERYDTSIASIVFRSNVQLDNSNLIRFLTSQSVTNFIVIMLTECFNIRIRFPRKPRKIDHADITKFTSPPQLSYVISVPPASQPPIVPKRKKPPRIRGINIRKQALLKALANGER